MKKEKISVILVSPENPDNIGAAARAVKNMGFSALRVVTPPQKWRTRAKKMAMSATDILDQAVAFRSLEEAVGDLELVVGTTRRGGGNRGAFLPFEQAISKIRASSLRRSSGVVFGRESKGLTNEECALCDHLVTIPAAPVYPSLNLAQAVMVMLFALSRGRGAAAPALKEQFLNKNEIGDVVAHFEKALQTLGYKKGGADLLPRILQTFRGLTKRSGLLRSEGQMVRGLSRRITDKIAARSCRGGNV